MIAVIIMRQLNRLKNPKGKTACKTLAVFTSILTQMNIQWIKKNVLSCFDKAYTTCIKNVYRSTCLNVDI